MMYKANQGGMHCGVMLFMARTTYAIRRIFFFIKRILFTWY